MEFLLSLCFYLSFLHIIWENRLYPICDSVLCWDFEVFYYLMDTFATAKAVNLKQLDDRVRKGRTGVHVLWTQSWIFPVHWSSHKQSLGEDSWKEAQWDIFQTVQGFCRMVLYSLDKAFPCIYSSPCHLQGQIICLSESTWGILARDTGAFWLEPQTEP